MSLHCSGQLSEVHPAAGDVERDHELLAAGVEPDLVDPIFVGVGDPANPDVEGVDPVGAQVDRVGAELVALGGALPNGIGPHQRDASIALRGESPTTSPPTRTRPMAARTAISATRRHSRCRSVTSNVVPPTLKRVPITSSTGAFGGMRSPSTSVPVAESRSVIRYLRPSKSMVACCRLTWGSGTSRPRSPRPDQQRLLGVQLGPQPLTGAVQCNHIECGGDGVHRTGAACHGPR